MEEVEEIVRLRDMIESMEKIHQLFILRIMVDNQVELTENKNGMFVNMTLLEPGVIFALKEYTQYVRIQQKQLDQAEDIKRHFKKTFYDKDNKEISTY